MPLWPKPRRTPRTLPEKIGLASTPPFQTCLSLLLPLVRPLGMVIGNSGSLIPRVTLSDQLADIVTNSLLIPALSERHRQYLGRGRFFLPATASRFRRTWRASR